MRINDLRRGGMTLVELLVVVAVGGIVFGLVLDALVETGRVSDRMTVRQQMAQDACLIAAQVERELRYRVPPGDFDTSQTLQAETTPALSASRPAIQETYTGQRLGIATHAPLSAPGARISTIQAESDPGSGVRRVTLAHEPLPSSAAPATTRTALGVYRDRFHAQIAFRYASEFDGIRARWAPTADRAPRLVEYAIMVWPAQRSPGAKAAGPGGVGEVYRLTGAVKLP